MNDLITISNGQPAASSRAARIRGISSIGRAGRS